MTLAVRNLDFSYPEKKVLENISLTVADGEVHSIIGPNGSGKSTLVKCMDGLLTPQNGDIFLGEDNTRNLTGKEIARRIGYVPQSSSQLFSCSVFETVLMGRSVRNSRRFRNTDIEAVTEILQQLDLIHLGMRDYNRLSGGQQQRVLIARSLAQEPEILLMDEPTSALDISHQLELMELVLRLSSEKNTTIIMILHDLNLAARFSHRTTILRDGTLHSSGPPHEVLNSGTISETYGVETLIQHNETGLTIIPTRRTPDSSSKKYSVLNP